MAAIESVALGEAGSSGDLSIWGLVMQADLVVQVVMIVLALSSIWCWAIIINKIRYFRRLRQQAEQFEEAFWSGGSLEELYERVGSTPEHPLAALFVVAMREWTHAAKRGFTSHDGTAHSNLQGRIDRVINVTLAREMESLERHIGFLATVGSTAPFVGLFGTVWGIMNSFQAIAVTKNTSLAVVAPGIAEALLATALGLVAAIPAVVAYNKLSNDLGRYAGRLESFAGEFTTLLSRQLGEGSM
ncbi:MAG TPA: protein TolQ [Alphaproteobacteria bacterium]|jgi:biopolymer transport protein TolQ|nr:MAG: Biopolymer transport protein ExbB [Alphaproteobacteria bacterium MarineAlpha9_Bin6]HHZ66940.1 protein TolQ [Alphaproteobacteria bacterium]HIB18460.1 protein TolQ [Alphaproteobacteria bacterium]HIN92507.1 protein TolQ [Alphaproteobacteria bacterium]